MLLYVDHEVIVTVWRDHADATRNLEIPWVTVLIRDLLGLLPLPATGPGQPAQVDARQAGALHIGTLHIGTLRSHGLAVPAVS